VRLSYALIIGWRVMFNLTHLILVAVGESELGSLATYGLTDTVRETPHGELAVKVSTPV